MPIEFKFTKPFIDAASENFITDIQIITLECLKEFPELHPKTIKFSYTKGFARAMTLKATETTYNIGYNPEKPLYYYVLGHELMHFAQVFSEIPHGEKSCDVYTLARSELFLDNPPCYIDLPAEIENYWDNYAKDVRNLCIDAIEIRKTNRQYIKWVVKEIKKLVKK